LKFVHILIQIRILFKIKICLNSKSEQILKFKLFKLQKRKQEKTEKEKNREEPLPGPAQYQRHVGGAE
jgi:hypothetical protein